MYVEYTSSEVRSSYLIQILSEAKSILNLWSLNNPTIKGENFNQDKKSLCKNENDTDEDKIYIQIILRKNE